MLNQYCFLEPIKTLVYTKSLQLPLPQLQPKRFLTPIKEKTYTQSIILPLCKEDFLAEFLYQAYDDDYAIAYLKYQQGCFQPGAYKQELVAINWFDYQETNLQDLNYFLPASFWTDCTLDDEKSRLKKLWQKHAFSTATAYEKKLTAMLKQEPKIHPFCALSQPQTQPPISFDKQENDPFVLAQALKKP